MNINMNFIHCYDEKVFNELIKLGFTPLKNDYPFVLANDKIEFELNDLTVFGNTIEFSDIMLF